MARPKKDGTPAHVKGRDGRPPKNIDYEALKNLCKLHCTRDECAAFLGVHPDTIDNHLRADGHGTFSEFFKTHSAEGKISLRRVQFQSAMGGSIPMQIWLGKQLLGQTDQPVQENDQNKPAPVQVIVQAYDASKRENSSQGEHTTE